MSNWAEKFRMAGVYVFLGIMALLSLFPFAWMAISATNPSVDVTKGKFTPGNAAGWRMSISTSSRTISSGLICEVGK